MPYPPLTVDPVMADATPDVLSSFQLLPKMGLYPTTAGASAAWVLTNARLYVRVWNPRVFTSSAAWWHNGATVSGNVNFAVHDGDLNLLDDTGSVAQAVINVVQREPLVMTVPAGVVIISFAVDNTTATFARNSAVLSSMLRAVGAAQQAGAFAAPDPAVPADPTNFNTYLPLFGISAELA